MPAKTRIFRLLLVALSTLAALAVAEGILRYHYRLPAESPEELQRKLRQSEKTSLAAAETRFSLLGLVRASPYRDIVYELKPNLVGSFRGQPVRTNSFGLRGHETTLAKPPAPSASSGSAGLPQQLRQETRDQYAYMTGIEHYFEAMARLGRKTRARGIPVVVMSLGDDNEGGKVCRQATEANGFHVLNAAPHFFVYMAQHGIATEHGNWAKTFRFPHDGHPNPLAHRLYAAVLWEELAKLGVAGPAPARPPGPAVARASSGASR